MPSWNAALATPGRAAPRRARRRAVIQLVLICLLASMACGGSGSAKGRPGLEQEMLAAVDRLLAPLPRFSGSPLRVARFRPTPEGGCPPALAGTRPDLTEADRQRLHSLVHRVELLSEARPASPEALRLSAISSLISDPTPAGRERMVRLLQTALATEPASPAHRNDLATAYLVRGSLDVRPGDLAEALELLDSGIADPHPIAERLLNRAYTLQCLTLWRAAEETWRRLPAVITAAAGRPSSPTRSPAPAGQGSADRKALLADPLEARRRGEWLLGEWGAQALRGDAVQAAKSLAEAEAIAGRLRTAGGDGLLSAAVAVVRAAEMRPGHAALLALARGHAAFRQVRGDAIYSECRAPTLRLAETQFASGASPFVGWVRLDEAVCAYFDKDFATAEEILSDLTLSARDRDWPALEGRSEWIRGLLGVVQARFVEADRHYSRAIQLFSRLGEQAHVVYLHSLRAKVFEYGGERLAAWRDRLAALTGRSAVRDPERRFSIFNEAVEASQTQGHPVAALEFLAEQMRAAEQGARESGKTDLLAYTLLARARLLDSLDRHAESAAAVAGAAQAWSWLSAGNESRRELRVEIDLQRVLFGAASDPRQVLAAIDRARAFFAGRGGSLGEQIEILKLERLRAHADETRGDFAAARADLLRGAREVERQRLELATMEDRARFLAQERGLFLDLVRLDLDRLQDPLAALAAFERSSNRVLLDSAGSRLGAAGEPFRPERLSGAFPADMLVVRFGHLPDRLLVWTFLGGRMGFEQRALPAAELGRQVARCRDLLANGADPGEWETACDLVAHSLVPRWLRELPEGRSVLLVPDEVIAPLPFAALRIEPRSPPLVARFRLSYAPSLTLLLAERGALRLPASPPRAILFVADPAFRSDLFPSFPRLPAASEAARGYATHYPHAERLGDRRATVPAVLAALADVDVFHFDGHGLTNQQYPERGGLLLAPVETGEPASSSILTAADLPSRLPGRLRLVILGACSTGLTTYHDTAEVAGLAATFLARGVSEVVAVAWRVPDEAAAVLLDRFHRELAAGQPTEAALATAQLDFARSHAGETSSWAAFQLFRGGKTLHSSVSSYELKTFDGTHPKRRDEK
jgi:hypothetical protein